ncbi:MAG: HNH endonuclease [Candidatus Kapabacteria bacterium]|jgi:hypothetical protein|nr:HNH endonuclease [Candidatus Kapabacteria bacterium]
MVNLTKSQPAPDCLVAEQAKSNGSVRNCPEVRERLRVDFYEKCYLCERHDIPMEIEHFIPHKGDKTLEFDWLNLFLACGHCNRAKGTQLDLLNCTNPSDDVLRQLEYQYSAENLSSKISIDALNDDVRVRNTAHLLTTIFNSTSGEGKMYSPKLRSKLGEEIQRLETTIESLLARKQEGFETSDDYFALQHHLSIQSPFFAFKYWFLRRHTLYSLEFQDLLAQAPLPAF